MTRSTRTRLATGLVVAAAVLAPALVPTTAQAAEASAAAYVVQGVADQALDVYVDSRLVRRAVPAKTVVGPLALAPGEHVVTLRRGSTPVTDASFSVGAGDSTDLVVHRFPDATRAPSVTVFDNDLSAVPPGKTRLRIAHTAVVGPADVVVDGNVLLRNLANGESATNVVPAGTYSVSVVPTATTGPAVLGPAPIKVSAGSLTNVYAIGDPARGSMEAVVHVIRTATDGAGVPSRVDTGDGGQAAALAGSVGAVPVRPAGPALPAAVVALAAGLAALVAVRGVRRRLPRW
ncbi:DUF4397 domain-containing protein [Kineosporia sp. A_224]|uniref:DUF4397 domain-containing protein n=1 Tax=Kineosporia sp. A_224 TaxID=1962180 RepID=UPI000B4A5857|nr:DUF4397 domain-containing protein [Kineosporia sp. A_224]